MMHKTLFGGLRAVAIAALTLAAAPALAGLVVTTPGTLDYSAGAYITMANLPEVANVADTAFVPENNFGNSNTAGQSFTMVGGGKLAAAELLLGGGPATYAVHLYDLGTGPFADGDAPNPLPAGYNTTDLFTGLSFEKAANADNVSRIHRFEFSGSDQVTLVDTHRYLFQLVKTGGTGSLTWNRDATPSFAGSSGGLINGTAAGTAYRETGPIFGGTGSRDFAFGIYLVPEPTAFVLFGLGLLGLAVARRRG